MPQYKTLFPLSIDNMQYTLNLNKEKGGNHFVEPKAIRALVALMDMSATLKGAASHFGGPSAFAEIFSSLFQSMISVASQENKAYFEKFHFVNDAGHCENALYALRHCYGQLSLQNLKGFRGKDSVLTGHGENHLFPEGVYLSNGPLGSSLAMAQGLAVAEKLHQTNKISIVSISDGACMEGEAKEALSSIPGLYKKGKMAPFILLISDNNTKLSGRIDEQSFSMHENLENLKNIGWEYKKILKGNSLLEVSETINAAIADAINNSTNKPIALHFITTKGFGTKNTVASSTGAHGFPLKNPHQLPDFLTEIYSQKNNGDNSTTVVPKAFTHWASDLIKEYDKKNSSPTTPTSVIKKEKIQVGISKALIKAKQKGLKVFSVSSDLQGSTGLKAFHDSFPNDFIDVGIAESNMISLAAGLSKEGFIPITDTFAQFAISKGSLPLIMANLSQAPVIGIFSHIGFQDAADGASHQSLQYLALTCSLPNTEVYCLSCSAEAEALVHQSIVQFNTDRQEGKIPKTYLFFLGRENFLPTYNNNNTYSLGQAQVIFDNSEHYKTQPLMIISLGHLLPEALEAAKKWEEDKQSCIIINPSRLDQLDMSLLTMTLKKCNYKVLTVEDHKKNGGLSSLFSQQILEKIEPGSKLQLKSLYVKNNFGRSAYSAKELHQINTIDGLSIYQQGCLLL
ncbi:MAG: transketolase [Bdellovibrionaceae bacterium]|nr:transketolase [Pseudobdellovibrionaceae bacterium]